MFDTGRPLVMGAAPCSAGTHVRRRFRVRVPVQVPFPPRRRFPTDPPDVLYRATPTFAGHTRPTPFSPICA